ncbi:MAG: hypothetical protein K2Y21_06845 [Phycisphaerales bacterium]|nr:hypothetical protein [Phycisphaerales bacterium]
MKMRIVRTAAVLTLLCLWTLPKATSAPLDKEFATQFLKVALANDRPTRAVVFCSDLGNSDVSREKIDATVERFFPLNPNASAEERAAVLRNRKSNADRIWREKLGGSIQVESYLSLGRSFRVGLKKFGVNEEVRADVPIDRAMLMLYPNDTGVGQPVMIDYGTREITRWDPSHPIGEPDWVSQSGRTTPELRTFITTIFSQQFNVDISKVLDPTEEMVDLVLNSDRDPSPLEWTFVVDKMPDGSTRVSITQPNLVLPMLEVTCSDDRCTSITDFQFRDPRKGTLLLRRRVFKTDEAGLPVQFELSQYKLDGSLASRRRYEFVSRSQELFRGQVNDLFPPGTDGFSEKKIGK